MKQSWHNSEKRLYGASIIVLPLSIILLLVLCGCDRTPISQLEGGVQVLFIGNSYTFVNDMPGMFANLVREANYDVTVVTEAKGGWTLADHAASKITHNRIAEGVWDYVVLQEHSIIPVIEQRRSAEMAPAAQNLVQQIIAADAQPLLFMTWGRRDGLPEAGFDNFTAMQKQLQLGYEMVAESLNVKVAPVGMAWQYGLGENPDLQLWDSDGSHPSLVGSYLTACVFYSVIVRDSPEGFTYTAGLASETAQFLQGVAAQAVLGESGQ
jgi:hypothetical protein